MESYIRLTMERKWPDGQEHRISITDNNPDLEIFDLFSMFRDLALGAGYGTDITNDYFGER